MKIKFTPEARKDISENAKYYNKQKIGLGREFRAEVKETAQKIANNPKQFPVVGKNEKIEIRRALTNRFPFKLFFLIKNIIEVFHVSSQYQDTSDIEK